MVISCQGGINGPLWVTPFWFSALPFVKKGSMPRQQSSSSLTEGSFFLVLSLVYMVEFLPLLWKPLDLTYSLQRKGQADENDSEEVGRDTSECMDTANTT